MYKMFYVVLWNVCNIQYVLQKF